MDCPGLVLPSFVQMEMQVLASTLAIAQMPSVPSCVNFIAHLMPLERVFELVHPAVNAPVVEDKRTWREGQKRAVQDDVVGKKWTAMDVMTAFAEKKGWVTAKAGRPDVHRAGNASESCCTSGPSRCKT